MWWPSPEALEDLTVEDAEEGFTLEAPDDSECGEWLAFWNQSPEHIEIFSDAFIEALMSRIKTLESKNGKDEIVPDQQSGHSEQTKNDGTGSVA
jgi:hypothetical protein